MKKSIKNKKVTSYKNKRNPNKYYSYEEGGFLNTIAIPGLDLLSNISNLKNAKPSQKGTATGSTVGSGVDAIANMFGIPTFGIGEKLGSIIGSEFNPEPIQKYVPSKNTSGNWVSYQKGGFLQGLSDGIKTSANPMNWGKIDMSNEKDFGTAYRKARAAGEKEFIYRGKRYNTNYAGTPTQQLRETGITDQQTMNKNIINRRFHQNISPFGYEHNLGKTIDRVYDAVVKNNKAPLSEDVKANFDDRSLKNRYDAFNLYTGNPQKNNTFKISSYSPSISKNKNALYYSINDDRIANQVLKETLEPKFPIKNEVLKKYFTEEELSIMLNNTPEANQEILDKKIKPLIKTDKSAELIYNSGLKINKDDFSNADSSGIMANFKRSKGTDEKGNYVSYYDIWDLAPFQNFVDGPFSRKPNSVFHSNKSKNYLGNAFEIYDRIYYKDYGDGKNKRMYYNDDELKTLNPKEDNFNILHIQQELSNRGYKLPNSTKKDGSFDGVWGEETEAALKDWQSKNKFQKGGFLGAKALSSKKGKFADPYEVYLTPEHAVYLSDLNTQYNFPEGLLEGVTLTESGGSGKQFGKLVYKPRPDVKSNAGAKGYFQFTDATAKDYGLLNNQLDLRDDFERSAQAAAKMLNDNINRFGSTDKALMAYNWGPANVEKYFNKKQKGKNPNIPKETKKYIDKVNYYSSVAAGNPWSVHPDSIPKVTPDKFVYPNNQKSDNSKSILNPRYFQSGGSIDEHTYFGGTLPMMTVISQKPLSKWANDIETEDWNTKRKTMELLKRTQEVYNKPLVQSWVERGKPNINIRPGRAAYESVGEYYPGTMYINKGTVDGTFNINDYFAELAHSHQDNKDFKGSINRHNIAISEFKNGEKNKGNFYKKVINPIWKTIEGGKGLEYEKQYNKKGSLEYEAHKEIEPYLKSKYNKASNVYNPYAYKIDFQKGGNIQHQAEIEGNEYVFNPNKIDDVNFKMFDNTGKKYTSDFGFLVKGNKHGDNPQTSGIKVGDGEAYIASQHLGVDGKKSNKNNPSVASLMLKNGGKALAGSQTDKYGINKYTPNAVQHHLNLMTEVKNTAETGKIKNYLKSKPTSIVMPGLR